jgi:hypothetical protein
MIITDCETKPHYQSKRPRKCYIYSKANWEALHNELSNLSTNIKEMCQKGDTVQDLWSSCKKELFASSDKYIPSKLIRSNTSLPWINHKIRKMFKKKARLYIVYKQTNKKENKSMEKLQALPKGMQKTSQESRMGLHLQYNNGGTREQQSEDVLEIY